MPDSLGTTRASLDALIGLIADEFLQRQQRGERPDIEEYAVRHPEAAELIRNVLRSLRLIEESGGGVGTDGEPLVGTLGDFRIMREVGRGGMGVVYEAEQISLGRRVALKVLPFAATMDPRHLQRFHNEARAAASLHHEHIVPVHAVGCERGVHFYAMQFIDGLTLAQIISRYNTANEPTTPHEANGAQTTPRPAATEVPRDAAFFRRVAEWGIQAALALEHAHSLGIVHRDVKPGNLMIDAQEKLWVTDFGLARSGAEGNLTMTGDVLGTLRYMSPEQALAKHGLVDHRTDVYALGATLYELFTGRPAVEGKDRAEILQRIAFEEPPPPRRLERAIPIDLQTVVLKALSKEPPERYATAKDLADDLSRFLEHRPVLAKRPGWGERAAKWVGRHRAAAAGTVGLLLLALACLGVTLVVVAGALDREKAALGEANAKLARSETNLTDANLRLGQAAQERKQHEQALRESVKSFGPVFSLIGPMLQQKKYAEAERLADRVAAVCRYVADTAPGDREERVSLLGVMGEAASRLEDLGMLEQVAATRRSSTALWRRSAAEFPQEATKLASAFNVARDHQRLAALLLAQGQPDEAEATYKEALDLWEQAKAEFEPEVKWLCTFPQVEIRAELSRCHLKRGRVEEAQRQCQVSLALLGRLAPDDGFRYMRETTRGRVQNALGDVLWVLGRHDDARQAYRQAIQHREEGLKNGDASAAARREQALLLAVCPAAELRKPARSVEIAKEAAKAAPYNPIYWHLLGVAHYRAGDSKSALEALSKSGQIWRSRGRGRKALPSPAYSEPEVAFYLAMAYWKLGDKAKAHAWYQGPLARLPAGPARDPDLERLRAEAAQLLGLAAPPDPKAESPRKSP